MFLHPLILWTGVAAAATPVIIHLLNRTRFRVRDWAAMRFLLESMRQNRRRLRVEELILLAVRCLLVLVLAAALARFTGCRVLEALPLGHTGAQSAVFVLDDSCSMGQKAGAGTVFTAATTRLAEQLKRMSKGDKVAIVLTSRPDAAEPMFKLTHLASADLEGLTGRLQERKPSDCRTALHEAMAAARKILADQTGDRTIHLLSDFRHADLTDQELSAAIRKEFEAIKAAGIRLTAWDYGREHRDNLSVESIELLDRFAVASGAIRVGMEVRNSSPVRAQNVEVRLSVRMPAAPGASPDKALAELPARVLDEIAPGESRRLEYSLACPVAGSAVISATLPGDELPADNVAHLALPVKDALRVLLVDGRMDAADPADSESFFVVSALDPRGDGSYGCRPDVMSAEALTAAAGFGDYDVVALLNVRDLPAQAGREGGLEYPALEELQRYVAAGGGLAIFTGDRVNLAFYNVPFYADGLGLCPLRIGAQVGDPARVESYFRLDPKSIAPQRMLRCFLGEAAVMTNLVRFFAFHPADQRTLPQVSEQVKLPRTLASFTDGAHSPAIVSRQYGKGTVVMFYTTASKRWNDWPIDEMGTYVAVVNDLMADIARPAGSLTGRVGEPLVYELAPALREAPATLKTPGYPRTDLVALKALRGPGAPALRYDRTDEAGVYELSLTLPDASQSQVLLARNVDAREGDLRPGGQADAASAFGSEDFQYVRGLAPAAADTSAKNPKEYWKWLLAATIVLLAVETFLGQRFGHYASE